MIKIIRAGRSSISLAFSVLPSNRGADPEHLMSFIFLVDFLLLNIDYLMETVAASLVGNDMKVQAVMVQTWERDTSNRNKIFFQGWF